MQADYAAPHFPDAGDLAGGGAGGILGRVVALGVGTGVGVGVDGRGGVTPNSPIATLLRSSGFGDMPIADCLLKAYCRSPKVLKEIARVISVADKACSNAVPEDFRELWAGFAPLAGEVR